METILTPSTPSRAFAAALIDPYPDGAADLPSAAPASGEGEPVPDVGHAHQQTRIRA